ncbi:ATP-dependent DNA helicase [Trichonephila clavipes]|nr:ATP-dependent DNA helicase [Trichonephila clavipes]
MLLATDHVILNHGQVTWTTPELAPPLLTTTPHQREDVSALDRFNVHRCPTRRDFSGTGLELVDSRLKQITGNFQSNFGGLDIILIGGLRQLPPVRSTPIYKQPKQTIVGPILWQNLKFYELNEVMRQANQQFSSILTKIGNGEQLDKMEITLIESRFCTVEEAEAKCPQGIRLFNTNNSVNEYNNKILNAYVDRITSTAIDAYIGCTSKEQETFVCQKLHKMSLIDTNGLPYQTVYVKNIYYMITTNIDVTDGLANGAVGKLVHVETNYEGLVKTIWLEFPDLSQIGKKLRRKAAG